MSDLPVPRRMERLLESFGADTEFRDAVIGDLAEEFAIRAREDGVHAARRWYYRESLRVAPYLVRDWWRGLRPRDVGYHLRTVGLSAVALMVFERGMGFIAFALVPGMSSMWASLLADREGRVFIFPLIMLLWTLIDGMFGGYVAARVGRRAPVTSALVLGLLTVAVMIIDAWGSGIVVVFRVLNATVFMTGIVAGGVLAATRGARAGGLRPTLLDRG